MFGFIFLVWLFCGLVQAAPGVPIPGTLGVQFDKRSSLPTLTLPDATYQAYSYDSQSDIYKFKNIRFAAPPVGDLRWAKPAPAPKNAALQTGDYGPKCPQASIKGINLLGDGTTSVAATILDTIVSDYVEPAVINGGSEDCLFLDVYVPGAAVRSPSTTSLPVIHWFYGGGFILGSKDQLEGLDLPFYDGTGLLKQSSNNIIYVASNYRLGAFGFLAGTTMENQGLPNAGLWDQRAGLQWTKDNIHLLGGDPTQVTAMGESAGAGSIMHHLVAEGGTLDPLFKRAIMQSAAFQPMWDRKGQLEDVFQTFANLSGCTGQGVSCLRSASSSTLLAANTALNEEAITGSFIVGPAPDGSFIRQLPSLEFASGNFYTGVDALISSHTSDEATLFVDGHVATDVEFNTFLSEIFPAYVTTEGITSAIEAYYPGISTNAGNYTTESARVRDFVRDSSITCNARFLANAYPGKIYNMEYATSPGWHATDLLPTFWDTDFEGNALGALLALVLPGFTAFANGYKSYLTSFIRTGNPNTYRESNASPGTINWPPVSVGTGEQMSNVLQAREAGFSLISDDQNPASNCEFWVNFAAAVTIAGGYAPPGSVVATDLLAESYVANASVNYAS